MFPCEMARYIALFPREARKYGPFWRPSSGQIPRLTAVAVERYQGRRQRPVRPPSGPDRVRFSISGYSPDIFWPEPVWPEPVSAAAEAEVAAAAAVAPGAPLAVAAVAAAERVSKPLSRASAKAAFRTFASFPERSLFPFPGRSSSSLEHPSSC